MKNKKKILKERGSWITSELQSHITVWKLLPYFHSIKLQQILFSRIFVIVKFRNNFHLCIIFLQKFRETNCLTLVLLLDLTVIDFTKYLFPWNWKIFYQNSWTLDCTYLTLLLTIIYLFHCITANCKPQTEPTKRCNRVDLNRLRPLRLFAHSRR